MRKLFGHILENAEDEIEKSFLDKKPVTLYSKYEIFRDIEHRMNFLRGKISDTIGDLDPKKYGLESIKTANSDNEMTVYGTKLYSYNWQSEIFHNFYIEYRWKEPVFNNFGWNGNLRAGQNSGSVDNAKKILKNNGVKLSLAPDVKKFGKEIEKLLKNMDETDELMKLKRQYDSLVYSDDTKIVEKVQAGIVNKLDYHGLKTTSGGYPSWENLQFYIVEEMSTRNWYLKCRAIIKKKFKQRDLKSKYEALAKEHPDVIELEKASGSIVPRLKIKKSFLEDI